jgi:predicted  nucleic acid-binding Zn-ribbon protein
MDSAVSPSRLWEQLASDIFVANLHVPLWGWADTRSLWLLDFWRDFDPNILFVLVASSPERMLASALSQGKEIVATEDDLLAQWSEMHHQMLRFHLRHLDRSVLIHAGVRLPAPSALVDHCWAKWGLPLDAQAVGGEASSDLNPLVWFIARHLCDGRPEVRLLQHEVDAVCVPLEPQDTPVVASFAQLAAAYRDLDKARDAAQQAADQRAQEIACLAQERDALAGEVSGHKQRLAELEGELSRLTQARDGAIQQARAQEAQIAALAKEKDGLAQKVAELEQSLQTEVQARHEAAQQAAACAQEIQGLKAAQGKLEAQVAALTQKEAQILKARDAAQQAHAALVQQQAQAEGRIKELTEENELLLVQLHQVQEELERYFLQYQEASQRCRTVEQEMQQRVQAWEERWQGVWSRHPYLVSWQDASCQIVDTDGEARAILWQLQDFAAAGRFWPSFQFRCIPQGKIVGIVLPRMQGEVPTFRRWPGCLQDRQDLVLMPAGGDIQEAALRVESIFDLGVSDWQLVQTLWRLLREQTGQADGLPLPEGISPEELANGFAWLENVVAATASTLRYDTVTLVQEQTNPHYHHVWLKLAPLTLGDRRWSALEFRLGCAVVGEEDLGQHPRLEFPESCAAVLGSWFVESRDSFGPKLELRFALPQDMDVGVWQRLVPEDQAVISQIILRLPAVLHALQMGGTTLTRPWAQWMAIAQSVKDLFVAVTQPAPVVSQTPSGESVSPVRPMDGAKKSKERGHVRR